MESHTLHTAGIAHGVVGCGLQRRGRLGPGEGAEAAGSTALSRDRGGTPGRRLAGGGGRRTPEGRGCPGSDVEGPAELWGRARTPDKWSVQLRVTGTWGGGAAGLWSLLRPGQRGLWEARADWGNHISIPSAFQPSALQMLVFLFIPLAPSFSSYCFLSPLPDHVKYIT